MAEYSILIVEDDYVMRRLLEKQFGKLYDVIMAATGEEALDYLSKELPDLIISDIMMPGMDGFTLQSKIRERQETNAIPFIFLTVKDDEESIRKSHRAGIDDYITKPFDLDQLLARVERLLTRAAVYHSQLDSQLGMEYSRQLMPKELPSVAGYRIFFRSIPRGHGGGDIFDWIEISPGIFFIVIGDVMGSGLQAKFYAFSFLGYIRSTLRSMLQSTHSPAELMKLVNSVEMDDPLLQDTFMSLLLILWEPERNKITYANAGHCRPILAGPQGSEIFTYSDIILGLDKNAEFQDTSVVLNPGCSLVAYTDGFLEMQMKSGGQLGEEGMIRFVDIARKSSHPVETLIDGALDNSVDMEFSDDALIFWLQRERLGTKTRWRASEKISDAQGPEKTSNRRDKIVQRTNAVVL